MKLRNRVADRSRLLSRLFARTWLPSRIYHNASSNTFRGTSKPISTSDRYYPALTLNDKRIILQIVQNRQPVYRKLASGSNSAYATELYRRTRRDATPRVKCFAHVMRIDTATLSRVKFINKRVGGFAFSVLRRTSIGTGRLAILTRLAAVNHLHIEYRSAISSRYWDSRKEEPGWNEKLEISMFLIINNSRWKSFARTNLSNHVAAIGRIEIAVNATRRGRARVPFCVARKRDTRQRCKDNDPVASR